MSGWMATVKKRGFLDWVAEIERLDGRKGHFEYARTQKGAWKRVYKWLEREKKRQEYAQQASTQIIGADEW